MDFSRIFKALSAAALTLWLAGCATAPAQEETAHRATRTPSTAAPTNQLDAVLAENGVLSLADLFDAGPTAMSHDPHVAGSRQMSQLLATVMGLVGTPYVRGGTTAAHGFDCSGFVRNVFGEISRVNLPRIARDQARATQPIKQHELQPGDLVFFNTNGKAHSHVGIYVGQGKFVHSPKPGAAVRIEPMNQPYWKRRFDAARRVALPEATPAIPTGLSTEIAQEIFATR